MSIVFNNLPSVWNLPFKQVKIYEMGKYEFAIYGMIYPNAI